MLCLAISPIVSYTLTRARALTPTVLVTITVTMAVTMPVAVTYNSGSNIGLQQTLCKRLHQLLEAHRAAVVCRGRCSFAAHTEVLALTLTLFSAMP